VKDFENRLRMQGMNMDLYYQFSGQNEEALRGQMRSDAEKRVRNNLVLEAIAKAEGFDATEEDLAAELENLSKQYNRPAEELRDIFEKNGNISNLQEDILLRKTIKFLLDNSKTA
jgi:trigger factor